MRSSSRLNAKSTRNIRGSRWTQLSDDELLDLRICDLDVQIPGSVLEPRIERLYEELRDQGIRFRPHCWLSDDWFSPDDIPGIAVPFYMAHPRLAQLERNQMLEVEGGSNAWCMKILRHEAGHCVDTAYRLHRRRRWREIFGNASQPYPDYYKPKPNSRNYVVHLESWYAQSHPVEDFAETFAVWLKPRSRWKSEYAEWPEALAKLEYVHELMHEVGDQKPAVASRQRIDSIKTIKKTLRQHYQEKRDRYGVGGTTSYDRALLKLFSDSAEHKRNITAASYLRQNRREFRQAIAVWTGTYVYTVDQVLKEMIDRCREMQLRVRDDLDRTKQDAIVMITVQAMNFIRNGHDQVAV